MAGFGKQKAGFDFFCLVQFPENMQLCLPSSPLNIYCIPAALTYACWQPINVSAASALWYFYSGEKSLPQGPSDWHHQPALYPHNIHWDLK